MKPASVLFILLVALCVAHKPKTAQKPELDCRNQLVRAEGIRTRSCTNLSLILDNWKYSIMTQVKNLLLHDHNTVLPDYGRIRLLSDALGDLYKEFNGLKASLVKLTADFNGVEAFLDSVRSRRNPAPPRGEPRVVLPGSLSGEMESAANGLGARPQGRRRIVVRRVKKPVGSETLQGL